VALKPTRGKKKTRHRIFHIRKEKESSHSVVRSATTLERSLIRITRPKEQFGKEGGLIAAIFPPPGPARGGGAGLIIMLIKERVGKEGRAYLSLHERGRKSGEREWSGKPNKGLVEVVPPYPLSKKKGRSTSSEKAVPRKRGARKIPPLPPFYMQKERGRPFPIRENPLPFISGVYGNGVLHDLSAWGMEGPAPSPLSTSPKEKGWAN